METSGFHPSQRYVRPLRRAALAAAKNLSSNVMELMSWRDSSERDLKMNQAPKYDLLTMIVNTATAEYLRALERGDKSITTGDALVLACQRHRFWPMSSGETTVVPDIQTVLLFGQLHEEIFQRVIKILPTQDRC